jgi:hypothetical protein
MVFSFGSASPSRRINALLGIQWKPLDLAVVPPCIVDFCAAAFRAGRDIT